MVQVSHLVFIDESGLSLPGRSIQSLWVSAAVAFPFERNRDLDRALRAERAVCFRSRVKEFKGHWVKSSELRSGITADEVGRRVADVFRRFDGHAWLTVTKAGCPVPPGFTAPSPSTKEIARQLLLERVNGLLRTGRYAPANWLLVWDLGNVQELVDLSAAVAGFADGVSGAGIDPRLYPLVLGGLSHDWGGLQVADIFAHFALHKFGVEAGLPDANPSKAAAFDGHLEPCLQRSATGGVVGLKRWGI